MNHSKTSEVCQTVLSRITKSVQYLVRPSLAADTALFSHGSRYFTARFSAGV
jgi:hypothetical protein